MWWLSLAAWKCHKKTLRSESAAWNFAIRGTSSGRTGIAFARVHRHSVKQRDAQARNSKAVRGSPTERQNRARGMRDHFMRRSPFQVRSSAQAARCVANTKDNQIRPAPLRDF